jgi:hypothetical protein
VEAFFPGSTLAKTDELDRHVIAHFAEAVQPPVRPLKDPQARELSALIAQRRQWVENANEREKPLGKRRCSGSQGH